MAAWQERWWGRGFLIFWAAFTLALTSIGIILLTLVRGGRRAFHIVGGCWTRMYFPLAGIRLDEAGWEDLPEDIRTGRQPALFMSTHESNLDPPTLIRAIRVPAVFISKKELKLVPLVGWAAWMGGTIFIDRSNRERSRLSLKAAAAQIRAGKTVAVFPEGTRSRTGELGPFKKGVFHLAMEAGVPVVPIVAIGGFQLLPAGQLSARPGCYRVRFGQPIHPADYASKEALLEAVQAQTAALRIQALAEIEGQLQSRTETVAVG